MGAITHVDEIIGLDKRIKKIAGEGSEVDLGAIANEYNPESTSPYPAGSFIIYEGSLYKSNRPIPVNAGEFDPTMWDQVPAFDETTTYNTGDNVEYAASVYRCDEDNVTGEFDLTKWTAVPQDYPLYDEDSTYYARISKVTYGDHYYVAGSNYQQSGVVGPFNPTRWNETQVVNNLVTNIKQYTYTGDPTETKTSQITIPVSGIAPINVFKGTITTFNDAGQDCTTDFIINATGAQTFGGTGKCVLVIPGYVSVKFLVLTITLDTVGSNKIKVELNRITEIGLVEGSLSISSDTEMIFPPVTVRLESYSTNVVRQPNSY